MKLKPYHPNCHRVFFQGIVKYHFQLCIPRWASRKPMRWSTCPLCPFLPGYWRWSALLQHKNALICHTTGVSTRYSKIQGWDISRPGKGLGLIQVKTRFSSHLIISCIQLDMLLSSYRTVHNSNKSYYNLLMDLF